MALLLGGRGTARPERRDGVDGRTGLRHVGGRLALLAVTALTAGAESGLALVLLLHLQAALGLEPQQIALLFLPGAIVLVVFPRRAYELAIRLGRARSMMLSLVAGALFTASLALLDTPLVVARRCRSSRPRWRRRLPEASAAEWASTKRRDSWE